MTLHKTHDPEAMMADHALTVGRPRTAARSLAANRSTDLCQDGHWMITEFLDTETVSDHDRFQARVGAPRANTGLGSRAVSL
jgi:hypothetical protein